jgi:hypothetical protein
METQPIFSHLQLILHKIKIITNPPWKTADTQCGKSPKKRHFSRFFKEGNLINNFYSRWHFRHLFWLILTYFDCFDWKMLFLIDKNPKNIDPHGFRFSLFWEVTAAANFRSKYWKNQQNKFKILAKVGRRVGGRTWLFDFDLVGFKLLKVLGVLQNTIKSKKVILISLEGRKSQFKLKNLHFVLKIFLSKCKITNWSWATKFEAF